MNRRRLKKSRRRLHLKKSCHLRAKKSRSSRIRRPRTGILPVAWRKLHVRGSKCKSRGQSLSFESLDFRDRQVLSPHEIADRVGCTPRHIYNLIVEGHLRAINISVRKSADRSTIRIPIESWRQFLNDRAI